MVFEDGTNVGGWIAVSRAGVCDERLEELRILGTAQEYVKNDATGRCEKGSAPVLDGPYEPPEACSEIEEFAAADAAAVRARLVGRWLSCGGSLFNPNGPVDVGLDFQTDGHFFRLYADARGRIVRGTGFEREGSFELIDSTGQLDCYVAGAGAMVLRAELGARGLRLNNYGLAVRYAPAP